MHRVGFSGNRRVLFSTLGVWLLAATIAPVAAHAQSGNLAFGKSVTRSSDVSSGRAPNAVDGSADTYWQPLMSDRQDDGTVWLRVDLETATRIDQAVLNIRTTTTTIEAYRIQTSDDDASWQTAFVRDQSSGTIPNIDTAEFPAVTSRYVRVEFTLNDPVRNFQLNEFELYDTEGEPPPVVLSSVYFVDATGRSYAPDETVVLRVGQQLPLTLKGRLSNDEETDLEDAVVAFASSEPDVASIDPAATVTAAAAGVTAITGTATLDEITREVRLWVDVYDPTTLLVELELSHPTMAIGIGQPAVLAPGDAYPVLHVLPYVDARLSGALLLDGAQIQRLPSIALTAGDMRDIQLPGTADQRGRYELRLRIIERGKPPAYDAFFFTAVDPDDVPGDQSRIAYIGPDARLTYVPDIKGNRILDFSNAGYMGGGVKVPDVQARVAVEPGQGDDTARIQAAIDLVSEMPQNAEGIRGAVLLRRGRFEVAGTLQIGASGVVLRGEGHEADGTILHATGPTRRDILEVGGPAGRMLLDPQTTISDLYVPSGARSFHIVDPSDFRVGDTVVVRRHGNDRWIHAIGMDQIAERPGSPGSTVQWSPFALDFDRVITKIEGNVITVDAPLANAIERRWGGGELIAYDDPDRIEQVGVENLRVEVEFDPSVTEIIDGMPYYADENHAVSFAILTSVKNAWVRDVTTLHLEFSLAHVQRDAKWVTVQDSAAVEMVSLITGGRRYNFDLAGQLTLVQRCHAETARHAFVVDSRVPGVNVFLDNDSVMEYATSEPHHRWSVGGLYDNVHADIAIQDRAWLGTGHGWAGANYVAWNTEGGLTVQQPPTAQNHAIGHVGEKRPPFVPNSDDPRPRSDGYWEHLGQHVTPRSLYLQQLEDRLGTDAVLTIERSPVGGGALDEPLIEADLPQPSGIKVGSRWLDGFSPNVFDYLVTLPAGTTRPPRVQAHDGHHDVEVLPATHPNGTTVLIVRDPATPEKSVRYTIRFVVSQ